MRNQPGVILLDGLIALALLGLLVGTLLYMQVWIAHAVRENIEWYDRMVAEKNARAEEQLSLLRAAPGGTPNGGTPNGATPKGGTPKGVHEK